MPDRLAELRAQRATAIKEARTVLDLAESEKRELNAEEQQKYDRAWDASEKLKQRIDNEERLQAEERELAAKAGAGPIVPEPNGEGRAEAGDDKEVRASFNKFLRGGMTALTADEQRGLQAGTDTAGGYVVAPQMFVNELIEQVKDLLWIRGMATTYTVEHSASLGIPSLENRPADADWTSELNIGGTDTAMSFGKRELVPHPLAKLARISNKLMRLNSTVDALMLNQLAYKFAVSEEKAFITGSGANQPLGVMTASAAGINTDRDVSTGNSATAIAADGLIEALYSIKPQYWPNLVWLFHRDAVKMISKLKDGDGQYLWQNSLQAGQPDMLKGVPVRASEYMPNTFTTGLYVGIIGDFSKYVIADALDMTVQRLVELFAATNETGYAARRETDGMPVLSEAFARVKLA